MNVVLSVTGSMITDRRLINGRMNIQTPDSLSQIDFCVNILDFVNVYLYDLAEDLTEIFDTLRPDFVEVINAYAEMFWVEAPPNAPFQKNFVFDRSNIQYTRFRLLKRLPIPYMYQKIPPHHYLLLLLKVLDTFRFQHSQICRLFFSIFLLYRIDRSLKIFSNSANVILS